MFNNEEDVKLKLVYEFLRQSGIGLDELSFEEGFSLKLGRHTYQIDTGKQVSTAQPRLDILIKRMGENYCVIEVKSDIINISQDDIDQAVSYGRLVHPIVPFCIITNGKQFKAVDTITKEKIKPGAYQLQKGYKISLPDEQYYEAVKNFLGYSRDNLLSFCNWEVTAYMRVLVGSSQQRNKKYIEELYVPPKELKDTSLEFIQSPSKAFIVSGDSGKGKTCWSCYYAKQSLEEGKPILFYRSGDVKNGILKAISEDLNITLSPQYGESQAAKKLLDVFPNENVTIIIDALDEIERETAVDVVDNFLKKLSGKNIKLIVTCKTSALEDFFEQYGTPTYLSEEAFPVNEDKAYVLEEIEDKQFFQMLNNYRRFYNFNGLFEDRVLDDCKRNPFLLRIMFEVATQKGIKHLTYSTQEIYEEYYKAVIKRFKNRDSIEAILCGIARCIYEQNEEFIDIDIIRQELQLSVLDVLPKELFEFNILIQEEKEGIKRIGFYFNHLRDYIIAFRALKWQTLSVEYFTSQIENKETTGLRLDTLSLYYSLASEEHKRAIDNPVYENASQYVSSYEEILGQHFEAFKGAFTPYKSVPSPREESIGFVGYLNVSPKRITYYGFRILQPEEAKVKLFPVARIQKEPGNVVWLSGARNLVHRTIHNGFQQLNVQRNVWAEIAEAIDEITNKGLLNECHSVELLQERIIATCVSHYKDALGIANKHALSKSLPLSLESIRYAVYYKRALRLLGDELREEKIASGKVTPNQHGGYTISIIKEEQEELGIRADGIASRGEYKASSTRYVEIDDVETALLYDISCLEKLGLIEITTHLIPDWDMQKKVSDWVEFWEPTSLRRAIENLYFKFLNEYRDLVERNFPTFCQDFPFYQKMPIKGFLLFDDGGSEVRGRLFLCREEVAKGNSIVVCNRDDFKENDAVPSISYKGIEYKWFQMWPVWPKHLLSPAGNYFSFKVDYSLGVLRNLVYKQLRDDLRRSFKNSLKQRGIDIDKITRFLF